MPTRPHASRPHAPRAVLLTLSLLSACAAADPDDAGTFDRPLVGASGAYLAGRHALGVTNPTAAADNLLRALAADPGNTDLQQQAFLAAMMAGRPEATQLARALPSNPSAVLVLANQDARAGRWREAEARLATLPARGPTEMLQPLLLAWLQQGSGSTDQALDTLRPFLSGTRYRGVYALHAAVINDVAGRGAEAGRLYGVATLAYGTPNLRLGTLVASWEGRSGHEDQARATICAMVDGSPDLSIAEPALLQVAGRPQDTSAGDGMAEAYLALAAALPRDESSGVALLLLRLAIDMRPGFTPARLLASDIEAANGQLQAASDSLAPTPASDPLIAVVQLRQAQIAERAGRSADAQLILQQLAQAYPDRPEPWAQLGGLQSRENHFADAVASYTGAIDRQNAAGASGWGLYYQRAMAYDRTHRWPLAEADFLRALELSPNQPAVLNYLGYAWAEQGRNLPRARQMLQRAVELEPNEGSIVDSLGYVMLLQGDHANAIRLLEHAVELMPEDSTVNGHLGDAYLATGRPAEAQTQWRRALILNPEPQDEATLQAKLARATPRPAAETAQAPAPGGVRPE